MTKKPRTYLLIGENMDNERIIESPDIKRDNRIPPDQSEVHDLPVLHYGNVEHIDIKNWTFTITGLVDKTVKLSYNEFMALPMVKVRSDIHCVTGWSRLNNIWEGVSTETLKQLINGLAQI